PAPTAPSPPVVAEPAPPPTVTAISPAIGSTEGTGITIAGTGFRTPVIVTLGGFVISQGSHTSTSIYASAPAHVAGRVDVVVTNPDGKSVTLAGGFTYASPDSFEANGHWEGGADSNYDTPLQFTIENNTPTSVTCGTAA